MADVGEREIRGGLKTSSQTIVNGSSGREGVAGKMSGRTAKEHDTEDERRMRDQGQ